MVPIFVGYNPMTSRFVGYSLQSMLGELIRKVRLNAGMTQGQLTLSARIDRSYLSEIERNVWHPTLQMLLRICRATISHHHPLTTKEKAGPRPA